MMNRVQMEQAALRAIRPLKVGINLPTTEGGIAGKTARWADLFALLSGRKRSALTPSGCLITCSSHGRSRREESGSVGRGFRH
jgi:hypothetical protein